MNRDSKPAAPLYDSIIAERKHEVAFAAWRERVVLFKSLFHGAGMSLINRKFRPWKAPGLKRKQSYKKFLQCYKFYYAAKKVMRDVLNDFIFHRGLRGGELTTAFTKSLLQFDHLSKIYTEPQPDVPKSDPSPPEEESAQPSPVDDKTSGEPVEKVNEERSSSDDSLGIPGNESNWNYNDDVSYDSDDAYDTNMFPGYGRSPRVGTWPTFTYPKRT